MQFENLLERVLGVSKGEILACVANQLKISLDDLDDLILCFK